MYALTGPRGLLSPYARWCVDTVRPDLLLGGRDLTGVCACTWMERQVAQVTALDMRTASGGRPVPSRRALLCSAGACVWFQPPLSLRPPRGINSRSHEELVENSHLKICFHFRKP